MLTRNVENHAYGHSAGSVPPFHACSVTHAAHGQAMQQRGGLAGGAVILTGLAGPGTWTGYGWLGMDPSDSSTWPRPFRPAPGMLSRPVGRIEYELSGVR